MILAAGPIILPHGPYQGVPMWGLLLLAILHLVAIGVAGWGLWSTRKR